uniref:Macaca fascicularis brain cDNA, clone: QmoA-12392 n=1 Tax=Macaca fascicularis TaxID=9541 RepID=I7GPC3_MACFA|nr:unnamed protein product [Macaca fascicularis]
MSIFYNCHLLYVEKRHKTLEKATIICKVIFSPKSTLT